MRAITLLNGGAQPRPRHHSFAVLTGVLLLLAALSASPAAPARAQTAPANDLASNAAPAGVPDLLVVDTRTATVDLDEPVPSCAPPGETPIRRTVWYTLVPPDTTLRVATAGSGTSFRPILALYSRDATGRFAQLACSDSLAVSAAVTSGQTYYLQVGGAGWSGEADGGQLSLIVGPVNGGISSGGGGKIGNADLYATLTDTPDPVAPSGDLTYVTTIGNGDSDSAEAVSATIATPASLTFRSVSGPAPWTCSTPAVGAAGPVTCTVASMSANTTVQITLVMRVAPNAADGTTISATATVSSSATNDPDSTNNAATAQTAVRRGGGPGPGACNPRPRIDVDVRLAGFGRLSVTIRATTNPSTPINGLQSVRLTITPNIVIDIPNGPQGVSGDVVIPIQPDGQTAQFFVRRGVPGGPFKVDLVVVDACGRWPSFVGGGASTL